jgi:formylglycine-generating enzyme required for sulfatase activity
VVKPVLQVPQPTPVNIQPEWANAAGEDEIGRWAEIKVGHVVQRFRYVPAGKFFMGSPDGEEGQTREGNSHSFFAGFSSIVHKIELPQHRVTISRGFWAADTACTQALWRVVMGDNPSRFKKKNGGGLEHPVECVSWPRVQEFIKAFNALVPGCQMTLPTEAEWEYACRAGTETVFSFGDNVWTHQINYDGKYPYGIAKKGENRKCTVPVKDLPANQWGLYQMHGNVCEWCADEPRIYSVVDDKVGVLDPGLAATLRPSNVEGVRALRGGSWFDSAESARAGCRGTAELEYTSSYIGFRLVCREI